jgi:tetratricopeptide (TPR) repeat protein
VLSASFKADIYNAYLNGDMALWKSTIDKMEQARSEKNDSILELVNYQYGYIAWCIGNKKTDLAKIYMSKGLNNIDKLEKRKYKLSELVAYKSAFNGYEIGLNKAKAPFIGTKSIDWALEAIKLDNNNPFGYLQYANCQFHMPSVFGGSKALALEYYLKTEKLMESNENFAQQNWNYLSLLTSIAKVYEVTGRKAMAKLYYEKILKIEPNFMWVKNELYPKILNK